MINASRQGILFVHPSPDLYGSDLQLVQTLNAFPAGNRSTVVLPEDGPLVELLESSGHSVILSSFPVLRKSILTPFGLPRYFFELFKALFTLTRLVRQIRPRVLFVNTITIPIWILVAFFTRTPSIVHVHEAEDRGNRASRIVLLSPLLLVDRIIANSASSRDALLSDLPQLASRTTLVHNGVPDRSLPRIAPVASDTHEIIYVGRLSPRKGTDLALDAVASLRSEGFNVVLTVCGESYTGYEWFRDQLEERAARPDLKGAVRFLGYVSEPAALLAGATVAIVPSRIEPFGNVAVEALLAEVPVVVANVQGLAEIVRHNVNGRLFTTGDAVSLATEISAILTDATQAQKIAENGRKDAANRFGVDRYHREVQRIVDLADGGHQ